MDTREAAEFTGLTEGTLRFYRSKGMGPPYTKTAARVTYSEDDLVAWMQSRVRYVTPGTVDD